MTTSPITLPEGTCDECGDEYVAAAESVERYRQIHPDDPDGPTFRRAARSSGAWVTVDENDNEVLVCPECVGRLKAERAKRSCPSWCTTDHAAEQINNEWTFRHDGPDLGMIDVYQWSFAGYPAVYVAEFDVDLESDEAHVETVGTLRQLAADALAAAEWLEAHR